MEFPVVEVVLSERIKNIIIDNFMDLSCLKLSETQCCTKAFE